MARNAVILVAVLTLSVRMAGAQTYNRVYDFNIGTTGGGCSPQSPVTFDSSGNIYGTASVGGVSNSGVVWEIPAAQPNGYEVLHNFGDGSDGQTPVGGVTFDAAGNMYGTTYAGGTASGIDSGTVWELTKDGVYSVLHNFGGAGDGFNPETQVGFDKLGDMFGTTNAGGAHNSGTVWEISSTGVYADIHDFGDGSDGQRPNAGVIIDGSGNVFGTASGGGAHLDGIVWEISSAGAYSDVHDFAFSTDGSGPVGDLAFDPAGDLFGTTANGGGADNGTVWELTKSGAGVKLHDFGVGNDGTGPNGVTIDRFGDLTGTTSSGGGGTFPPGTIWQITSGGVYSVVRVFDPNVASDGFDPLAGTRFDAAGNMYGTTFHGGLNNVGMVWKITPRLLQGITLTPAALSGGATSTGKVFLGQPAPSGGLNVNLTSNSGVATVPSMVTVPAGASSVSFTITTTPVSKVAGARITATLQSLTASASLTVYPPAVSSVMLSPATLFGGTPSTGTVNLAAVAPTGGVTVSLTSSAVAVKVPASVTVPAGDQTATFAITTIPVTATVKIKVSATDGLAVSTAYLTVVAPQVTSITVNPTHVLGGVSVTGTVNLNAIAPSAGLKVSLSSSASTAHVPPTVTVASGATSATFNVTTLPVGATTSVTLTANGKTAVLTVLPPKLTSFTLSPTSVTGGASSTATVTLTGAAPTGGFVVNLSSSSSNAQVPSSVTVPAGKTSATVTVKTSAVTSNTQATLSASQGATLLKATLTIQS